MMTFTINETNEIVAFATPEEAAATTATPFDSFSSQEEFAELAKAWPAERLVATWNGLPGVVALKKLPERKDAKALWVKRIWERVAKLGQMVAAEPAAAKPEAEPAKPKADKKAKGGAQAVKGALAKGKAGKKAPAAKPAPKGKKGGKAESEGPRAGSKMADVIGMLQRKNGASITEIMSAMGWQRHTVRGFMAGAMKKAGYQVESFKPEGGERTYRISK